MFADYLTAIWHYILPKQALTQLAGVLARAKIPALKSYLIRYFVGKYDVNLKEAQEEALDNYPDFNSFFIRRLKPECRPIADAAIVSPVDGFVSEIGCIKTGTIIQAKGLHYTVDELLGCDKELSSPFNEGLFATLYLSPKDYHRVHMPIEATLKKMIYVPGKLFSVQPATARLIPKLFAGNERLVVFFDTEVGPMAMVLVGATIVGAIGTCWHGDLARGRKLRQIDLPKGIDLPAQLKKAEEMGYFKLGSTVILLFADPQKVQWQNNLKSGDAIQFGQALGFIN